MREINKDSRALFNHKVDEVLEEFKKLNGDVDIRMPRDNRLLIYRATFPSAGSSELGANRFRDRVSAINPRENYRLVVFSDQYRFGGSAYDTRQPMRPSENHLRAKFDGPPINNPSTEFPAIDDMTSQEYLATQLHLYAWALGEFLTDVSPPGIKTIDNVNIVPEVSEVQEDIIELPVVQAVALNFTVYTD